MAERERKGKRLLDFTPQVAITLANKNSVNTIFSMPSLALKFVFRVEICYDAHTLVSLSPNNAEHSKAKRSIFFVFFVSMAKDVLLEEGLCCASVYFCHMILRRETKMCGVVVNDVHMSSFTWAVEIGFTYYVQKEFSG